MGSPDSPVSYREYHLRHEAELLARREALRQEVLGQVHAAVRRIAPRHPAIRAVHLFGSLVQPGRFSPHSDVDLAVDCDDVAAETPFWREMEMALERNVDLRPREGAVARAAAAYGELLYDREVPPARG